jgi:hypothetical protein
VLELKRSHGCAVPEGEYTPPICWAMARKLGGWMRAPNPGTDSSVTIEFAYPLRSRDPMVARGYVWMNAPRAPIQGCALTLKRSHGCAVPEGVYMPPI